MLTVDCPVALFKISNSWFKTQNGENIKAISGKARLRKCVRHSFGEHCDGNVLSNVMELKIIIVLR